METKVKKYRYQNIFGEWKEATIEFVPIREVSAQERIDRLKEKGLPIIGEVKNGILYDVWVNGKKLTRGTKKFIKDVGQEPEFEDFFNMDYITKVEKLNKEIL
jgi:hypothetical protein